MPDNKPVREYLWIEAWQYEDGGLGWSIKSQLEQEINSESLENILLEMTDWQLGQKSEVLISTFMRRNGDITIRRCAEIRERTRKNFVWSKENMFRTSGYLHGRKYGSLRVLKWWWSLCWWLSQFKRSQNAPRYGLASAPPAAAEALVEPLETTHEAIEERGKVLPFKPVGRAP